MKRVIPLRYGTAFKKALGDPQLFTNFVKAVLGIDIEIERVETEKSFFPALSPISVRFDLFAEDTKNRLIIEIQHEDYIDHYDRFLYYHSTALVEMTRKSDDYRPIRTLYTIVVQTSADRHGEDMAVIDMDPIGRRTGHLNVLNHKIVFLFSKHFGQDTPPALQEWLRAVDDTLDSAVEEAEYANPWILRLFDLVEEDHLTPDDRAQLIEDHYIDQVRAEGEAKGEAKTKRLLAIEMLRMGLTIDQVENITGLDQQTLQSLLETTQ